jgi:hypothetical protein
MSRTKQIQQANYYYRSMCDEVKELQRALKFARARLKTFKQYKCEAKRNLKRVGSSVEQARRCRW